MQQGAGPGKANGQDLLGFPSRGSWARDATSSRQPVRGVVGRVKPACFSRGTGGPLTATHRTYKGSCLDDCLSEIGIAVQILFTSR
jgi:hypothetical protein